MLKELYIIINSIDIGFIMFSTSGGAARPPWLDPALYDQNPVQVGNQVANPGLGQNGGQVGSQVANPGLDQNPGQVGSQIANPGLGQNPGQVGNQIANPGLGQNSEWEQVCRRNKIRYPIGSDLSHYKSRDLRETDLLYQRNMRSQRSGSNRRIVILGTRIIPNFCDHDYNLTIDSMIDFIDKNRNRNFENCGPTQLQYGMIKHLITNRGVTQFYIGNSTRISWSDIRCNAQLRALLVNNRR